MKKFAFLFVAIVLIAAGIALCGCGEGEKTIKVGVIAEITGSMPEVGVSCENAARLAVKELNSAGGVEIGGGNYSLELSLIDCEGQPEKAAAAARELVSEGVLAIIGPNASSNAMEAANVAEESGVVLITPWSTNPKTTLNAEGNPREYVFRACFTDIFEGEVLAGFSRDNLKAGTAAVLYDETTDVLKSQAELFRKSFEGDGGKVTAFETYRKGDTDFNAQFVRIKAVSPDVVFLPSYYTDIPIQLKQARGASITAPFLGSDAWATPELVKESGQDCEGSYICNHYSPESSNPLTRQFVASYQAEYGEIPTDVAALTYDAFSLLQKALTGAVKVDRQAVRDAFANTGDYWGVTGDMRFQPGSGDPAKGAVILRIDNGKFEFFADFNPLGM